MKAKLYAWLTRLSQTIGATRPGAWLFARFLHDLDQFVLHQSKGQHSLTGDLAGLPIVTVTTIGAKSGRQRTIPLVYVTDPADSQSFALIASNFGQTHHPSWYYNLKAHPQAICTINGQTHHYQAREATPAEYKKFWQAAVTLYNGYTKYKERVGNRHIPIFVLTPISHTDTAEHE
ncbi:MAG: nitroreductase family deazaflavin-dependent oxidoreductase [Anaerolineales bacterium]|nr:nitroreductase family deazaflavin-dependent oxidoreductase [Anaerolineales bacterium]